VNTPEPESRRGNGHPDCVHCHGGSFFWRGEDGEATLCELCRSCCECYHGEPFESDFAEPVEFEPYEQDE
jgi:hypothetical protein